MSRNLKNPETPILSETPIAHNLKVKKAEFKEKKMLSLQQKALKDPGHVLPDITKKSFEAQLRQVATKGVVRLFNAVRDFQLKGVDDTAQGPAASRLPIKKRSKQIAEDSRKKFEKFWDHRRAKRKEA